MATPMENLLDCGHVVYTDRCYTSVPLADTLASRGTGLVSTLVRDRKGLPPEVRAAGFKMASNEVLAWRHSGKLVVAWCHNNKKPVLMLSTTFSGAPMEAIVGRRKQVVMKPDVIVR